jgi:hypothetical protein
MKRVGRWKSAVAWAAATGTMAPQGAIAQTTGSAEAPATATASASALHAATADVVLEANGTFHGQAVTAQGAPAAGVAVAIEQAAFRVDTVTGPDGKFTASLPRGGVYQVKTGMAVQACRVWAAGTAPPRAASGLLLVQDGQFALGQHCGTPVAATVAGARSALSHPLVFGGIVAAAIAIPVALHNSDDDPAS